MEEKKLPAMKNQIRLPLLCYQGYFWIQEEPAEFGNCQNNMQELITYGHGNNGPGTWVHGSGEINK